MRIRGVLFDKDGTLLDYWRTWIPINRAVALFAARGDQVLAGTLLALGGHDPITDRITPGSVLAAGTHDEIAEVFAAHLGNRTPPRLAVEIERIFQEGGAKYAALVEGVEDMLVDLSQRGFVLGVATNDSAEGLARSLGRHPDVLAHFQFLAGCDSGHGAKPEPGMVHAFCRAMSLGTRDVAVVGDAVHDLEMGRRAGVGLRIGVLGGTSPREVLAPHADVVLESAAELRSYFAR